MISIIADAAIPYLSNVLEPYAQIQYLPASEITNSTVKKADALLIRTRTFCNKALLENTAVKFIGTATIGYDHIDTEYCQKAGIRWTNAPGCNSASVMQYMASVFVNLAHIYSFSLIDKTVGIIGYGNVGKKVEIIAKCLGMKVLLNDVPLYDAGELPNHCSIETLQRESDFISFHVPLNYTGIYKTHLMVDNAFLYNSIFKICNLSPIFMKCIGSIVIPTAKTNFGVPGRNFLKY